MEKFTNFRTGLSWYCWGVLLTCYKARVAFVEHSEVPEKAYIFHIRGAWKFLGLCASPRISVPSLHRVSTDALIN